jgi:hypothetical protein
LHGIGRLEHGQLGLQGCGADLPTSRSLVQLGVLFLCVCVRS